MADLKDAPRDGSVILLDVGDDLVPGKWQEETHSSKNGAADRPA